MGHAIFCSTWNGIDVFGMELSRGSTWNKFVTANPTEPDYNSSQQSLQVCHATVTRLNLDCPITRRLSMQNVKDSMHNPFVENLFEVSDEELAIAVCSGGHDQLEILLTRHLSWVFNLSLRMLHRRADADDATQEIMLKVIKGLPGFRGQAKFRTWLDRIAVNHLLNAKKSKWAAADAVCSFSVASAGLRQVPDLDPPDPQTVPVPVEIGR